jgi:glycosyltransferase involved in cell wall biosynthesis
MAAALLGNVDASVTRSIVSGHIDPAHFGRRTQSTPVTSSVELHLDEASTFVAIHELVDALPALVRKREEIQRRRRRTDAEVAELFGRPFKLWPFVNSSVQANVVRAFGIQEIFADSPRRVLVLSPDILPYPGLPTVGSGLRAWGLARALEARGHEVVLSMPVEAVRGRENALPTEAVENAWDRTTMRRIVGATSPDVVLVCGWPLVPHLRAEKLHLPVVLDQPGPHFLERRYQQFASDDENRAMKLAALSRVDYFTSSGDRQHEYFARWLADAGWSREEIDERTVPIPYSLPPALPHREPADELTFVYGGVFLPWQDPTIALETVADELRARDGGWLHLYGGGHPISSLREDRISDLYARLAQNPRVVRHDLIPYDDLIRSYAHAHVAVDLMARNRERELAFTTRTVVYLWCGLPVIYNNYSELSEYIARYDAGWTLDPSDREGIRAALAEVFSDPDVLARKSENARRLVLEELDWTKTVEPLDQFIRRATIRRPRLARKPKPPRMPAHASVFERIRWVYRTQGSREVARRTVQAARRRVVGSTEPGDHGA